MDEQRLKEVEARIAVRLRRALAHRKPDVQLLVRYCILAPNYRKAFEVEPSDNPAFDVRNSSGVGV